ncbi:hypothetical protein BVRB_7g173760 [Beta vulgaris subsp. vulgaris]|uniref:uncharacterized protein LOC104900101 n=1 Tax=Beta vulgaris subsp. vulgaris TaxID=3555 RepID=UPI00053F6C6C|nr:uncharacterized protein LOC104900101 [Beta vulgaris subsp. vulgaris]XP_010685746.1 uncharacterized protein LOC104900101 [Beta vulgaris subsp. vulgaris]XP_057252371.1 uncharacterized protein LOC104900101 [Beta vulgaris subsp. vulgaris]KMT05233.1 hypothetical protein BVRB_7g173760 [Beta vulgaris subsp. vulgaris]
MAGGRGKGSRSKPKVLALGPAEHEPLQISFYESTDDLSDGEDGKTDISNREVIPLVETQVDEMISDFIVSDGLEEEDFIAVEVNDGDKDVVTGTNVKGEKFCTQEGIKEDVNEVSDGNNGATDVSVEDNGEKIDKKKLKEDEAIKTDESPEEDEAPLKFGREDNDASIGDERKSSEVITESVPTNNEGFASPDRGIMENMTDNVENDKEPSKLDVEEPGGALSDRGEEEHIKENTSITNEVKEVAGQINRPKKKVMKKKVVKKVVRRRAVAVTEEMPQSVDENPPSGEACEVDTNKHNEHVNDEITSDEACKENKNEHVANEEKAKEKSPVKVNKKPKVVRRRAAAVTEEMPQSVDENTASGEACKVDTNEHVKNEITSDEAFKENKNEHVVNEEKEEVKPPVKINKKRKKIVKKKAPQGHPGIATVKEAQGPQSGNDELKINDHIGINKPDVKNEEVEKDGDRASPLKTSRKKKLAKKSTQEGISKDVNKAKPSKEGTSSKRIDSMGMIFMCSSETKKDCYKYKILGLPAGKKDVVLKIYKGMRLFLFDVNLRMMYGIYKAAGPGGYNIEPSAFKSQFPSQVRFAVLEDCVPLAEERFRKVLKDNYYTKNKFNCQLNSEQVKNLCKLFHETSKKAESIIESGNRRAAATSSSKKESGSKRAAATTSALKKESGSRRAATALKKESGSRRAAAAATSSSARRDKKRKRVDDRRRGAGAPFELERSRRRGREDTRHVPVVIDDRGRIRAHEERRYSPVVIDDRSWRRAQEITRHVPVALDDRSLRRAQEEIRHAPVVINDRYRGLPIYERETYLSSVAPAATLYQPLRALSPPRTSTYAYDRALGVDPYRRDSVLDHQDLGLSSSRESRLTIQQGQQDTYLSYREREPHVYSGPIYSTDTRREHYDYTPDGRYADYRPPPPLYRRY